MFSTGKRYIEYPSRADELTLWNLADCHIGAAACSLDRLEADIATIRDDPNSFWVGGGDYADYIPPGDPRFDADTIDPDLKVSDLGQLGKVLSNKVRDLFKPIKDKCLGLCFGNHEHKYERYQNQQDLHAHLCIDLEVPNLGFMGVFDVVFARNPKVKKPRLSMDPGKPGTSRQQYRVLTFHGTSFATTPAGKINSIIKAMNYFDADWYFMGHVHEKNGHRAARIGWDEACTKMVQKETLGIITGAYLKTYEEGITTYGEQKIYSPAILGASWIRCKPDKNEFWGRV